MEYQLKPIGKVCAATGEPLAAGTGCYSALVLRGGELVRLDFAEHRWNGPPEGTVGYWKTTVPAAEPVARRRLDPDSLMRHFEQLCEEDRPATEKLRYVLALMLLQKRRLELDGIRRDEDGVECLTLVGTRGEGTFEVRDQRLDEDEMDQLQKELGGEIAAAIG